MPRKISRRRRRLSDDRSVYGASKSRPSDGPKRNINSAAQDKAALDEAVAAIPGVTEVFTRDGVPATWAQAEADLGTALYFLGTLTKSAKALRDGRAAIAQVA